MPVIDDLRESARMANKKMLKKLLVRLQEPDSVAECLRIVGHVTVEVLWKRNRAEESVFGKERSVREERVR